MTANRWGVLWPDNSYTGAIAQFARDLTHYAKTGGGKVYEVGGADDPERRESQHINFDRIQEGAQP